jgi:hypothetical protein
MEAILVKPKNKEEFDAITFMLKKMKINSSIIKKENKAKQKAKQEFLDSLPHRLNEVKLHMQGKIKLKSWDEVYNEL